MLGVPQMFNVHQYSRWPYRKPVSIRDVSGLLRSAILVRSIWIICFCVGCKAGAGHDMEVRLLRVGRGP